MPEQDKASEAVKARTRKAAEAQAVMDGVKDKPGMVTLPDGRSMSADELQEALDQLAAPFAADRIEKLPKQLRRGDEDKGQCVQGSRYSADGHYCGGWHARSMHLDYVGHAGVTDRLNAVDPFWTWEPMALTDHGTPLFSDGGMWIRLTVLGITRLGFGDASGKQGPSAVKELIGDAIRNGAMRFGVATYLWSKSDAAKAIAAGGDPDAAEPEPQHSQRGQEPIRGGNATKPEPNEHSQRVWAAFNALDDRARVEAQRSWPSGLPGPDYITALDTAGRALAHIEAVYREHADPQ